MTERSGTEIAQLIVTLDQRFTRNRTLRQFVQQFELLLEQRRAELEAGVVAEARCLALIGASGCGKSFAAKHLIANRPDLMTRKDQSDRCELVSLSVPTPATVKGVGLATLHELGYQMKASSTEYAIWQKVRLHLKERRTLFLHYDEAQDISLHQSPRELRSVVNTLKSLMQDKTWPVGLILTGMPALKVMINHDPQLARRVFPIEYERLNPAVDRDRILRILRHYGDHAQLRRSDDVLSADLVARLAHAADREFGLMIKMIIEAIREALIAGSDQLLVPHFVGMFRRKHGCIDGLNPFIAPDYERIDVRKLLNKGLDDDPTCADG